MKLYVILGLIAAVAGALVLFQVGNANTEAGVGIAAAGLGLMVNPR